MNSNFERLSNFVARDNELQFLFDSLQSSKKILIISGFAGVGKTSLALEFLYRFSYHNEEIIVRYFNCQSKHEFESEYLEFAIKMKYYDYGTPDVSMIERVYDSIQKMQSKVFYLFDNLKDFDLIKNHLINIPDNLSIIITTRLQNFMEFNNQQILNIKLEALTRVDGEYFFIQTLKNQLDSGSLNELLDYLCCSSGEILPSKLGYSNLYISDLIDSCSPAELIRNLKDCSYDHGETVLFYDILTENASIVNFLILAHKTNIRRFNRESFYRYGLSWKKLLSSIIELINNFSFLNAYHTKNELIFEIPTVIYDEFSKYVFNNPDILDNVFYAEFLMNSILPERIDFYIEKNHTFEDLKQILETKSLMVITGHTGIGKTSMIQEFSHFLAAKNSTFVVRWLQCETKQDLLKHYSRIANHFGIFKHLFQNDDKSFIKSFYGHLKTVSNYFQIYLFIDNIKFEISEFLRDIPNNLKIIVTTSNIESVYAKDNDKTEIEIIRLGAFTRAQAQDFLNHHFEQPTEQNNQAKKLIMSFFSIDTNCYILPGLLSHIVLKLIENEPGFLSPDQNVSMVWYQQNIKQFYKEYVIDYLFTDLITYKNRKLIRLLREISKLDEIDNKINDLKKKGFTEKDFEKRLNILSNMSLIEYKIQEDSATIKVHPDIKEICNSQCDIMPIIENRFSKTSKKDRIFLGLLSSIVLVISISTIIFFISYYFQSKHHIITTKTSTASTTKSTTLQTTTSKNKCNYGFQGKDCDECGILDFDIDNNFVTKYWPTTSLVIFNFTKTVFIEKIKKNRLVMQLHFCIGTLIDRKTVLVPATCIPSQLNITGKGYSELKATEPSDYKVYFGVKDRRAISQNGLHLNPTLPKDVEIFSVSQSIKNSAYNDSFMNDIGILRLEKEVVLSKSLHIACLPDPRRKNYPQYSMEIYTTDWYLRSGSSIANVTNYKIRMYNNKVCEHFISGFESNDYMYICGGSNTLDSTNICSGSLGAPLFVVDYVNEKRK